MSRIIKKIEVHKLKKLLNRILETPNGEVCKVTVNQKLKNEIKAVFESEQQAEQHFKEMQKRSLGVY